MLGGGVQTMGVGVRPGAGEQAGAGARPCVRGRRVLSPLYRQLHEAKGLDYAELLNSEGECLVELGCHHLAGPPPGKTSVCAAQGRIDSFGCF